MVAVLAEHLKNAGLPAWLTNYVGAMAFITVVYVAFMVIERFRPVEKTDWSTVWLNVRLALVLQAVILLLAIWLQPVLARAVSGWLPQGTGFIKTATFAQQGLLFVAYLMTYDFLYYWLHRAQHRYDSLWAIHKLHHSEPHVNVTTTLRVHWIEEVLKAVVIIFPVTILFDAVPAAGWLAAVLGIWLFFVHANLRVSFGPLSWLLTSPAAHRIHHSLDHSQANRNFAVIFPIWDILFGTYQRPVAGQWPKTGIAGESAPGFWSAVSAPWSIFTRRRANPAAATSSPVAVRAAATSSPVAVRAAAMSAAAAVPASVPSPSP